jgi:outer membrane protein OmpA-like peptidoglycan-associated protein
MKIGLLILLSLLWAPGILQAQEKRSRADVLYFEYAYREAIAEYHREGQKKPLSPTQQLNLAHSYFKTGNYDRATEAYLRVFKQDTVMTVHQYNDMFQAMARTSGMERVKAFLATREDHFSEELLENAEFNFELLEKEKESDASPVLFNLRENSPQADFAPAFYHDRLLFTSARSLDSKQIYNPSGEAFLDIFVARLGPDGNILNTNPFTAMPSGDFHEATPYFSESLNKLFYILSNSEAGRLSFDENGRNALAIGLTDMAGNFSYLLRDLSTSFYYPYYDRAGQKLYFAANFEDSYGGTDIYYVYTNDGLIMSAPVNLGPRINTPGNEIAPYIFEDSFYFSSDIFYGLGGMDLYKAVIQQEGGFSIPVNLGRGLNSPQDDFGLIIRENKINGLIGYFASNRPGGKGKDDLYGFRASEKPGLKTLVFRGSTINPESGFGIDKVAVTVRAADSSLIKQVYTNDNGAYRIEIPAREQAQLEASKPGYATYFESLGPERLDSLEGRSLDIEMVMLEDLVRETEGQTVIKMDKFFFTLNRSAISPEITVELNKAAEAVRKFPRLKLRIETHTDSRGSSAANLKLSQSRADAIKNYLVQQGTPAANIVEAKGYGEEKILNNCTDGVYCLEILHKQNERQLIVVLNYQQLKE